MLPAASAAGSIAAQIRLAVEKHQHQQVSKPCADRRAGSQFIDPMTIREKTMRLRFSMLSLREQFWLFPRSHTQPLRPNRVCQIHPVQNRSHQDQLA